MHKKSDIEIAQETPLYPISDIARELGIGEDDLEPYGRYKAKVDPRLFDTLRDRPDGKLVLVTAITPTPGGRGQDDDDGGPRRTPSGGSAKRVSRRCANRALGRYLA